MSVRKKSHDEINRLIIQLRGRIEDVIESHKSFDNDFYLFRWLLQNKMIVERAENRIRESIAWRKENNADELAEGDWAYFAPGLENEVKMHYDGFTKSGQPVTTSNGEGLDLRNLLHKYGKDAIRRYFIQFYVKLEKCMMDHYKFGPTASYNSSRISTSYSFKITSQSGTARAGFNPLWYSAAPIHIVSYKNFSLWNTTSIEAIQLMSEGAHIGMTHFPTTVSAVYFVNLNKVSNMVLKILKPIISTDVLKLEFYGTDKSKWSKELQKHVDAEQLQVYFGGTKVENQKQDLQHEWNSVVVLE